MSKKVFIFGESGRMGTHVKNIVDAHPSLTFAGGYQKGSDSSVAEKPDLVIDFSLPEATPSLCEFVKTHGCAVVSGTTGWSSVEKKSFEQLSTRAPIFWSANMSFGVYLMCQMTEWLARYQDMYRYRIEETHHIHKKDKPSGTALLVKDAAEKVLPSVDDVESIREGEVFGIHRFMAQSDNELIEVRHEALNRKLFAQGAVDVGVWLMDQPTGLYTMDDFFQHVSN